MAVAGRCVVAVGDTKNSVVAVSVDATNFGDSRIAAVISVQLVSLSPAPPAYLGEERFLSTWKYMSLSCAEMQAFPSNVFHHSCDKKDCRTSVPGVHLHIPASALQSQFYWGLPFLTKCLAVHHFHIQKVDY